MSNSEQSTQFSDVPWTVEIEYLFVKDETKEVRCASLNESSEFVSLIDQARKVHLFRLNSQDSWVLPIAGNAIAMAQDREYRLVIATDDGSMQLFDMRMPFMPIKKWHVGQVRCMAFDPYTQLLVAGMSNGESKLYDLDAVPSPELVGIQRLSEFQIQLILARKDVVIGVDKRGRISCLRYADGKPLVTTYGKPGLDIDCYAITQHPFLWCMAIAGEGPYVQFYSVYNLPPMIIPTSFPFIRQQVFLGEGSQFIAVGPDGFEVWDPASRSLLFRWRDPFGRRVLCVRVTVGKIKVICG